MRRGGEDISQRAAERWLVALGEDVSADVQEVDGFGGQVLDELLELPRDALGLPASMEEKKSAVSWYAFALRYLAMKWPHAAPNTRDGINESLTKRDAGTPRGACRAAVRRCNPQSTAQLGLRATGA